MHRIAFVIGLFFLPCVSANAQDVSRLHIFGGYSYVNADFNGVIARQSANGWEASVSGNFNKLFALEGDVSGYYKTVTPLSVHDYAFAGGPRINFRPVFVHALVGFDRLTGSAYGYSVSQNSFAGAFGGGVQWPVADHWAVRGSTDYVLTQHNIFGGSNQNNFRVSAGIVFMFSGEGGTRSYGRAPKPSVETGSRGENSKGKNASTFGSSCTGTNEAPLLGVTGCTNSSGFLVAAVRSGSPAAVGGVKAGDIITSIDGRPVQTSLDIDTAIAANTAATLKLSYMIKGTWLTEQEVKKR